MKILAETAGRVSDVRATAGQAVAQGDTILVIEVMKMELEVAAPRAGVVIDIMVRLDDMVKEDQPLAVLQLTSQS